MIISVLKWPCLWKGTPDLWEADPASLAAHATEAAGPRLCLSRTGPHCAQLPHRESPVLGGGQWWKVALVKDT